MGLFRQLTEEYKRKRKENRSRKKKKNDLKIELWNVECMEN